MDSSVQEWYTVAGSCGTKARGLQLEQAQNLLCRLIRGGRGDAELYASIIKELSKYGTVLTEHVGDAALAVQGEDGKTDEYIYHRDVDWLTAADVLVAEVTTPSLGVGIEIGIAQSLGKTIFCLYRSQPDKSLSAMIAGNPNVQKACYLPEQLPELLWWRFSGLK